MRHIDDDPNTCSLIDRGGESQASLAGLLELSARIAGSADWEE
jgi:hypothetical protein